MKAFKTSHINDFIKKHENVLPMPLCIRSGACICVYVHAWFVYTNVSAEFSSVWRWTFQCASALNIYFVTFDRKRLVLFHSFWLFFRFGQNFLSKLQIIRYLLVSYSFWKKKTFPGQATSTFLLKQTTYFVPSHVVYGY